MPRSQPRATSLGSRKQSQGGPPTAIPQERLDKYTEQSKPQGTPRKRRYFVLRYTDEHKFNWYAQTLDPITELPKQWTTAPLAAFTWTTREAAAIMRERTLQNWRETQGIMMPMPKHYPFVFHRIDQDYQNETHAISAPVEVIDVAPTVVSTRAPRKQRDEAVRPAGRGSDLRGDAPAGRKAVQSVADKAAVRSPKKRVGKQPAAIPSKAGRKHVPGQGSGKALARKPVHKQGNAGKRPAGKRPAKAKHRSRR